MLRGMADATLRIGELARRSGVSADLLRAWERRYALFEPVRTAGGYRLYSADDEARVRSMQAHLAQGLSAAEAARLVREATAAARSERRSGGSRRSAVVRARRLRRRGRAGRLRPARGDVRHRNRRGDGHPALPAHARRSLARRRRLRGPRALRDRPPARAAAGPRPRLGPRRRSSRAARLPVRRAPRPRAHHPRPRAARSRLARDVPRSRHADRDARSRGRQLAPDAVVLSSLTREPLAAAAAEIAQMAASRPVLLAGPGADAELAERSRARLLAGCPIEAADEVSAERGAARARDRRHRVRRRPAGRRPRRSRLGRALSGARPVAGAGAGRSRLRAPRGRRARSRRRCAGPERESRSPTT